MIKYLELKKSKEEGERRLFVPKKNKILNKNESEVGINFSGRIQVEKKHNTL